MNNNVKPFSCPTSMNIPTWRGLIYDGCPVAPIQRDFDECPHCPLKLTRMEAGGGEKYSKKNKKDSAFKSEANVKISTSKNGTASVEMLNTIKIGRK